MILFRDNRSAAIIMFIAWMVATALRSRYAHPYELLWWTGIVASGAAMFASGYLACRAVAAARARRGRS